MNERKSVWTGRIVQFFRCFYPYMLTGLLFESLRFYYWWGVAGHIHIREVYDRDLRWFGFTHGGVRITPSEFFLQWHTSFLDVICGFAYLFFVAELLLMAFWLFYRRRYLLVKLSAWAFFLVNLMGYCTYFIYPAAAPWYVTKYGFGPPKMNFLPEGGATYRFDDLFGVHIFHQMYAHGIDVYGSYPSLHVTYPLIAVWLAFVARDLRWVRIPAVLFYLLMCFSAVYLQQHFMVDVVLGTIYALLVIAVVERARSKYFLKPIASGR